MEQRNEIKEFPTCPCGESETLVGQLRKKVEEKGLRLEGYPTCLTVIPATMVRQGIPAIIGQKVPAGVVELDVCMGCGVLRAVRVQMTEAVAGLPPQQQQRPLFSNS